MNMYMCMKINYINSPFIKLKVMAYLCSHHFIGYVGLLRRTTGISGLWGSISTQNNWNFWSKGFDFHAEQLEFLVYGVRFARFYFRTISLPNLTNRNQSLPEPWRHSRVHAIRCTHRWKGSPCIITEGPPFTIHVINVIFRQSNNQNMSTLYLNPTPPPQLRNPHLL